MEILYIHKMRSQRVNTSAFTATIAVYLNIFQWQMQFFANGNEIGSKIEKKKNTLKRNFKWNQLN